MTSQSSLPTMPETTFIGGGNMASAILGGLIQAGHLPRTFNVVEPDALQREKLQQQFGVSVFASAGPWLAQSEVVVWAVKPQMFAQAAATVPAPQALHLSVMAGVPIAAIMQLTAATRVVRCMPNTPALIGQGIAGFFANAEVNQRERNLVEQLLQTTGQLLWVDAESKLDAVTAISGSGPAYVFYFTQALAEAAVQMGLTAEQGKQLALATVQGSAALAAQSTESLQTLRERVTSKGGTTAAALNVLMEQQFAQILQQAAKAAQQRAAELGKQFHA